MFRLVRRLRTSLDDCLDLDEVARPLGVGGPVLARVCVCVWRTA
jgi:hypothetical protein